MKPSKKEIIIYLITIILVLLVLVTFVFFNFMAKSDPDQNLTSEETNIPVVEYTPENIPDPTIQTGSLIVTSNPVGARVLIDEPEGEVASTTIVATVYETPFRIEQIATGRHTISVAKEGYEMQEIIVDVLTNQISRVTINLLPTSDGFLEKKAAWKAQLPIIEESYSIEYDANSDTVYVRMMIPDLPAQEYMEAAQNIEDETRERLKQLGISTSIQKVEWELN